MSIVILGAFGALTAAGIGAAIRDGRRYRRGWQIAGEIAQAGDVLWCGYSGGLRGQVVTINGPATRKQPFVVVMSRQGLALHTLDRHPAPVLTVTPDQLRWFGRPQKYTSGKNDLLVHIERDAGWHVVRLTLFRHAMQGVIRALKDIATPDQVTAYRRRRPYVHHGPVTAQPAVQDVLGAWTLSGPVTLYLMPLFLVILEGVTVRRTIPLDTIQNVTAIRRLDQPKAAGLVRFEVDGETGESLAFALDRHDAFAASLAEAAKRTLEDPVVWQRKKKKPGDFDDDDEDA